VTPMAETLATQKARLRPSRLSEGHSYLGLDQESSFSAFSELVKSGGRNGLILSTIPPDEIREKYELEKTPIGWLANSQRADAIDPGDLAGISASIASFMMRADTGSAVVLLD